MHYLEILYSTITDHYIPIKLLTFKTNLGKKKNYPNPTFDAYRRDKHISLFYSSR